MWRTVCVCVCVILLNHLRISCWCCAPFIPKHCSVYFLQIRILFYVITVAWSKLGSWTFICYYQLIHSTISNFVHSSNNMLYLGTCVAFRCHTSFVSFELEQFLGHFLSSPDLFLSLTLTFLKSADHLFCRRLLDLGLSDVSSWLDLGDEFLAEASQKQRCIFLAESSQRDTMLGWCHYGWYCLWLLSLGGMCQVSPLQGCYLSLCG